MSTVAPRLITADEFLRAPEPPDGAKQELVRGRIVTMPLPGFRHGACQVRVASLLDHHVRAKGLGRVTVESGLITERDPDTVRGPDIAYWSTPRLPLDQTPGGYPDVPADLCIEIVSPSDSHQYLHRKVLEYLDRGVRLVWVIDPELRTVSVYRSRDDVRILDESDTLTGDNVLPDFECKVEEVFA